MPPPRVQAAAPRAGQPQSVVPKTEGPRLALRRACPIPRATQVTCESLPWPKQLHGAGVFCGGRSRGRLPTRTARATPSPHLPSRLAGSHSFHVFNDVGGQEPQAQERSLLLSARAHRKQVSSRPTEASGSLTAALSFSRVKEALVTKRCQAPPGPQSQDSAKPCAPPSDRK